MMVLVVRSGTEKNEEQTAPLASMNEKPCELVLDKGKCVCVGVNRCKSSRPTVI